MNAAQRRYIRSVVSLLDAVRKEHGDVPIQMLETLLVAGLEDGLSQSELMDRTHQTKASISRNIRAWTSWTRHRQPGPAYLEAVVDPYETRRKLVRLTERGRRFIDKLSEGGQ